MSGQIRRASDGAPVHCERTRPVYAEDCIDRITFGPPAGQKVLSLKGVMPRVGAIHAQPFSTPFEDLLTSGGCRVPDAMGKERGRLKTRSARIVACVWRGNAAQCRCDLVVIFGEQAASNPAVSVPVSNAMKNFLLARHPPGRKAAFNDQRRQIYGSRRPSTSTRK